mgnify:CR=1 FL=1
MTKRKFSLEGLLDFMLVVFNIALTGLCVWFVRQLFVAYVPAEELTWLEWMLILPLGVALFITLRSTPYLIARIIDKIFPEQ